MDGINVIKLLKEPVLCYIEGNRAYFTTCPLEYQWGDDWNDAPYEHNAGTPYSWHEYQLEADGIPQYEIEIIVWEGGFDTPQDGYTNSPFSVEMINRGDVAWLRPSKWGSTKDARSIFAGCTVSEFKRLIWLGGGDIYQRELPPVIQEAEDHD